jgi:hypothetical protein
VPALPPSEETAPLPSSASPAAAACPRKRELFSASSRRSAANESPVHEAPASGLTPPAASPREREPLHARDLRHKLQQGAQRDATTLHSPAGGGGKGAMPPPTASAGGFGRGGGAPSPGLLEATQPEWPVSAGGGEGAGRKGDAEEGGGGGVAGDGALGYCASAAEDGGPAGSGGSGHGVDVHTESAEGASGVSATQIFVTKLPAGIDTGWVQRMFQVGWRGGQFRMRGAKQSWQGVGEFPWWRSPCRGRVKAGARRVLPGVCGLGHAPFHVCIRPLLGIGADIQRRERRRAGCEVRWTLGGQGGGRCGLGRSAASRERARC